MVEYRPFKARVVGSSPTRPILIMPQGASPARLIKITNKLGAAERLPLIALCACGWHESRCRRMSKGRLNQIYHSTEADVRALPRIEYNFAATFS